MEINSKLFSREVFFVVTQWGNEGKLDYPMRFSMRFPKVSLRNSRVSSSRTPGCAVKPFIHFLEAPWGPICNSIVAHFVDFAPNNISWLVNQPHPGHVFPPRFRRV